MRQELILNLNENNKYIFHDLIQNIKRLLNVYNVDYVKQRAVPEKQTLQ